MQTPNLNLIKLTELILLLLSHRAVLLFWSPLRPVNDFLNSCFSTRQILHGYATNADLQKKIHIKRQNWF